MAPSRRATCSQQHTRCPPVRREIRGCRRLAARDGRPAPASPPLRSPPRGPSRRMSTGRCDRGCERWDNPRKKKSVARLASPTLPLASNPASRKHAPQHPKQHVRVKRPLVRLVHDDGAVALEGVVHERLSSTPSVMYSPIDVCSEVASSKRMEYPTKPPISQPFSSATLRATDIAATRLGCVQPTMRPPAVRPSSCKYCASCVVCHCPSLRRRRRRCSRGRTRRVRT